ncbi:MAG: aminotransferase class IV [Chthoniobacteraceae bacterium]|jgi:branched-subunit amino acid aminotransferase/4-amino-4-deoxychorismate lyase
MEPHADSNASDSSHAWLWSGSAFEPATGLPPTDRGFRYGMSVFESIRIHNGIPLFLEDHLQLLDLACQAVGFVPPAGAAATCGSLLNGLRDGFARIYVTAGDGPVTAPANCRLLVFVEPRDPIPSRVYHRGYDLTIHPDPYVPDLPGLKTGNYWRNLRAFNDGIARQSNEVLLISPEGILLSASMANVFVVNGKRMMTPVSYLCSSDSCTCRPGVVREWVMHTFQGTAHEGFIRRDSLETATEIFLTSSWLGIMPVATLDGRRMAHVVGRQVLDAYRKEFGFPAQANLHD